MNVLFIATYSELSGANQSLLGMIKYLRAFDVHPYVVLPKHGPVEDALHEQGIPFSVYLSGGWLVHRKDQHTMKALLLHAAKAGLQIIKEIRLRHLIEQHAIDILHINTVFSSVGLKAGKKLSRPVVWHIREFVEEDHDMLFYDSAKSYKTLALADKIIAISDCVYNKFHKVIPADNMVRIYNGIDISGYDLRPHLILSGKTVTLTLAGRFSPGKGHVDAIKAMKEVVDSGYTNVKLQFAGSESLSGYQEYLEKLIRQSHLDAYISFLGFQKDMNRVWRNTDIALVCSRAEAFGRITAESMISGCLVIGADTAGTAELIKEKYGLLYRQGDSADLAGRILYAIQNRPQMMQLVKDAKAYALESFTAEQNARSVYHVYEQLLKNVGDNH